MEENFDFSAFDKKISPYVIMEHGYYKTFDEMLRNECPIPLILPLVKDMLKTSTGYDLSNQIEYFYNSWLKKNNYTQEVVK